MFALKGTDAGGTLINRARAAMEASTESSADAYTTWPLKNTTASANGQKTVHYKIASSVIFITTTFFLIGLNSLVIISYLFKRIPRTLPNFYIFHMAMADILVGFSLPVNMMTVIFESLSRNTNYCKVETLCPVCCMMASNICSLALTSDRWQALKNSLTYDSSMTTKRFIERSLLVWVIPILGYLILPMAWSNDLTNTPLKKCYAVYIMKREFVAFVLLPGILVIFGVVVALYIPIIQMAVHHVRAISASSVDAEADNRKIKSHLNILKTATLVLLPFYGGWMPWCLTATTIVYSEDQYDHPGLRFKILAYLSFPPIMNSFINPIIYATRMPEYRRAFKACLGCVNTVGPASQET